LWWVRRDFRNERCYSTVVYGLGVSYATIFPNTRGQRKIHPLLRNVYKQNAYFRGNEHIDKPLLNKRNKGLTVEFPQQLDMLTNAASKIKRTLGQGVLYPVSRAACQLALVRDVMASAIPVFHLHPHMLTYYPCDY
jgi:hypothetical protein